MNPRYTTFIGRAISLIWVAFWTWFVIASILSGNDRMAGVLHAGIPVALSLIAVVVAWRWAVMGGALLLSEGLLLGWFMASGYLHPANPAAALFLFLTLAFPPIVAGLLFLDGSWRSRRKIPA